MTEIIGRYVRIRDVSTYFETSGSGPNILLMHASGRETRQWHGVMTRLSTKYHTVAVDLPGHGKSMPFPGHEMLTSMDEIADWLGEFTGEAFGSAPFVAMGCSIGGNLSLLLGARLKTRVLAAVSLQGADYTPFTSNASLDMLLHPQLNPMHGSVEFSRSLVGSQATEAGFEFMMWQGKVGDPITRFYDLGAYTRCDIREEMKHVECPVLLVHGSEDWVVPLSRVDATLGRLTSSTDARIASLDGLGHAPHVEDPERVFAAIAPFLARHVG